MATSARKTSSSFGRAPDYRSANEAIDGVLANAAFKQRGQTLRRQYKQSEKRMEGMGMQAKAASERVAKTGLAVQQTGAGIAARNTSHTQAGQALQQRVKAFNTYTAKHTQTVVNPETGKKEKVITLTGAQLQAWKERKRALAIEQKGYKQAGKTLQGESDAYNASLARARGLQRRAEKLAARYKALHKAYVARYQRYKRHVTYEPYRPA